VTQAAVTNACGLVTTVMVQPPVLQAGIFNRGVAMPQGTPYSSFALPYSIRVDCFTSTDHLPAPYNTPALHLLTHTHWYHILGLPSKSFAARIICSPDAREMLLRHEVYLERAKRDVYEAGMRTFAHLKIDSGALTRDLVVSGIPLPIHHCI